MKTPPWILKVLHEGVVGINISYPRSGTELSVSRDFIFDVVFTSTKLAPIRYQPLLGIDSRIHVTESDSI